MKFPWKGVALGSGILTFLVAARCVVTVERALYYGRNYGMQLVMEDPWFYIGMAAAAICVIALLVLADQESKRHAPEEDPEITEE
jgi:hypothetical protein